jgi:glycosyltransferase involved in cell wall biosynthesis
LKVSVIIPIYNAMEYLPISLEKVLNQTYHNIEILLVDNNSKDGSYDYIKTLEKNDCRVKALIATMQGPNYARKVGFEASTGDYVLFCDSDDFVEQDAIENFVGKLEETNADIVIGNYKEVTKKDEFLKEKKGIPYKYYSENLKEHKDIIHIKPALWNKIFKRDLIKESFFITSKIGEDMVITISSIMEAKNIAYMDKTVYHYVPNDEGLSNSVNVRNLLDILTTTEELKKIAKSQNTYSKYEEEIEFLCFTHVIYKILRTVMMENDEERIEVYTKLREYLKKNHKYKETKYYRTKMYYKIAAVLLMNKNIYNLKIFRKMLKAIFENKTLYKCFKKLDN